LRARRLLTQWKDDGLLSEEQYQQLEQDTTSDLRTTNIFLRLVLLLFTLFAVAAAVGLFFALATPDYAAIFLGEGIGLLGVAVALEIVGALWLWRIVRATAPPPDLATFLDAVVVGLEAGLTFERALAALVERAPRFGRMSDARRLLADLALGRSLPDALRGFGRSGDDARIAALVVAATRFGAPLAQLLVIQADALRTAERRRAEADARRLPVLMLFPLSLTILPALLLVFLGPPLLSLLSP